MSSWQQLGRTTALFALAFSAAAADLALPEIFSDNLVMQRDRKVPVFGTADPGEKITVSVAGRNFSGVADDAGNFSVEIGPFTAGGPYEMTVAGNKSITIRNLLFGEVWLCGGQSNMEWQVQRSTTAKEAMASADYPEIRLFQVIKATAATPQKSFEAKWSVCSPETVGSFSAVGYFFGRELYTSLKIPIGLISSNWGGTRIEPWTPPAGFRAVPGLESYADEAESRVPGSASYRKITAEVSKNYRDFVAEFEAAAAAGKELPVAPEYPRSLLPVNRGSTTALYNAMIAPLVPYAIRGAIWYQGEANLADGMLYADKMAALVGGWRKVFNNPEMSFYFVQLAPFIYQNAPDSRLPELWVAQQAFADSDHRAGMVVINDVATIKDIHPPHKEPVGKRLAALALKRDYGKTELKADAPQAVSADFNGDTVTVRFVNVESFQTRDGKAPDWFEVAGPDGVFEKADAEIAGTAIKLKSAKVAAPCQVRFAWKQFAEPNLRNEAGLQLGAFRFAAAPAATEFSDRLPDAAKYKLIYRANLLAGDKDTAVRARYESDFSGVNCKKIKRIAYLLETETADGKKEFITVSLDPFTQSLSQIGIPSQSIGRTFQQKATNLEVKSNVAGVKNGKIDEGNLEFWFGNYSGANGANVPGASATAYDFGDEPNRDLRPGYGSMQIHNTADQATLFAYNAWSRGKTADIGIGNAPSGNPDWTFSSSGGKLAKATLLVFAEIE